MKNAIFFIHYKNDQLTYFRFRNLERSMPDWEIVPVGFSGQDLLSKSIYVEYSGNNEKLAKRIKNRDGRGFSLDDARHWSSIHELIIYAWAASPKYDNVLICEYDVFQNCPLYSFFEKPTNEVTWTYHSAPRNSSKKQFVKWFREMNPESANSDLVRGKIASCGTLFQMYTRAALDKMHIGIRENANLYKNCFCELVLGIEARINKLDIGTWKVKNGDPITDYFHPSQEASEKVSFLKNRNLPVWTHPDKA